MARVTVFHCFALFAIANTLSAAIASEPHYPNKPIRFIVPYPAGSIDAVTRKLAQKLSDVVAQPVIIENRPGASTILGAQLTASASADGYTFMTTTTATHVLNPLLFAKLPYDADRDFAPIIQIGLVPLALVVGMNVPATSVKELIEFAKSGLTRRSIGSFGTGSTSHLYAEVLKDRANIDLTHVPYKGGTQALTDVIGGHISMMFVDVATVAPFVAQRRVRAIALTGNKRVSHLAEVPTMAEAGLPGFELVGWHGVFAPARVPATIQDRMAKELQALIAQPEITEYLVMQGVTPTGATRFKFAELIRSERQQWNKVIQAKQIRLD